MKLKIKNVFKNVIQRTKNSLAAAKLSYLSHGLKRGASKRIVARIYSITI